MNPVVYQNVDINTCALVSNINMAVLVDPLSVNIMNVEPIWDGLVLSVSASDVVGCGFASRPYHSKDHQNRTNTP